ncbi:multiple sugar transport system permease protein [Catenuloplanes nepalensis]|uniref:Multiple sugar transport system permease protein n=1 Tax=Catenuloplanes nepalensis TaxID=587533 RepID=A0ABT9MX74_9ACTN|nr:carbohydrate ABC transporter permease [Catenuloplanes nepalensis]MDP9795621.1 multiple sugar transport system permease protein [Catenuloplanes nepalensis]
MTRRRVLVQLGCVLVTLFMGLPLYLIALASFTSRDALNAFPLPLLPTAVSGDTMNTFLRTTGIVGGMLNSLTVGLSTVALATLLGVPGGYALARFAFRGRDAYQVVMLLTRALPIVVLSVPLAKIFIDAGLYDTTYAVTLLHTALALPSTILITAAVFAGVSVEQEEAAMVFGAHRWAAFLRIVAPQALPGIAAAAVFTFVTSWNEVLGASILTLNRRTLPAHVLATLADSPLAFRFVGGLVLVLPAIVFIALVRRYLLNMWGTTLR